MIVWGCILRQLFNGKEIIPGEPIKKGSEIDLEIGKQEHFQEAQ